MSSGLWQGVDGPPTVDAPDRASQSRFSRSARKASENCLRPSEKTVGESLMGVNGANSGLTKFSGYV